MWKINTHFSPSVLRLNGIFIDKYSSSPSRQRASGSEVQASGSGSGGADSRHERRNKSSSVNNCYLSSSSNSGQHQSQQQKPLSISANNFSPASNFSDSNKVYKSSSHNVTTGGTCDKNYQQQPTQQQYNSSRHGNNSAAYLSQSNYDFEHMLSDPNDPHSSNNQNVGKQSYNTTASGSSRSSRSYNPQPNQNVTSDQFQGWC